MEKLAQHDIYHLRYICFTIKSQAIEFKRPKNKSTLIKNVNEVDNLSC